MALRNVRLVNLLKEMKFSSGFNKVKNDINIEVPNKHLDKLKR